MYFEIIGRITDIETIAVGSSIRDIARLRKRYGRGRWRKLKGVATVRHKIETRFAVCVQNQGCEDLELGKVYQVLADESAAQDGYIRVIDESGEDYLYPADYFVPVVVPREAERALLAVTTASAAA